MDGQQVSDPNNKEIFPNELFKSSLLVMPNPDMLYTERNIPHGKIHYVTYFSTVLKEHRTVLVYTPADYDRDIRRKYPVFYLVSGTTDTEETWYKAGRNVISARRTRRRTGKKWAKDYSFFSVSKAAKKDYSFHIFKLQSAYVQDYSFEKKRLR